MIKSVIINRKALERGGDRPLKPHLKLYDLFKDPLWKEMEIVLRGLLGLKQHSLEKAHSDADSLKNPVASHDLCGRNHTKQAQSLMQTVNTTAGNSLRE
jgi:hypothetical protein